MHVWSTKCCARENASCEHHNPKPKPQRLLEHILIHSLIYSSYSHEVKLPQFTQATRTHEAFYTLRSCDVVARVPDPVSSLYDGPSSYTTREESVVADDVGTSVVHVLPGSERSVLKGQGQVKACGIT